MSTNTTIAVTGAGTRSTHRSTVVTGAATCGEVAPLRVEKCACRCRLLVNSFRKSSPATRYRSRPIRLLGLQFLTCGASPASGSPYSLNMPTLTMTSGIRAPPVRCVGGRHRLTVVGVSSPNGNKSQSGAAAAPAGEVPRPARSAGVRRALAGIHGGSARDGGLSLRRRKDVAVMLKGDVVFLDYQDAGARGACPPFLCFRKLPPDILVDSLVLPTRCWLARGGHPRAEALPPAKLLFAK